MSITGADIVLLIVFALAAVAQFKARGEDLLAWAIMLIVIVLVAPL